MSKLIGRRYGRLVVVAKSDRPDCFDCQCDCGGRHSVYGSNLTNGSVRSCGCLNRENIVKHGRWGTKVYRAWDAIRQRCMNPKNLAYPYYGGRGITFHPEWAANFEAFLADVGEPSPGQTIDRIDNTRGYEPGNVRWVDMTVQARNKRSNIQIIYDGRTQCLSDWAKEIGVAANTLRGRLNRGWTVEAALTTARSERHARNRLGALLA